MINNSLPEYVASNYKWRGGNNKPYGFTSLVSDFVSGAPARHCRFTLDEQHHTITSYEKSKEEGVEGTVFELNLYSLPRLFFEYCTALEKIVVREGDEEEGIPEESFMEYTGNTEDDFWRWLIPETNTRRSFRNNKKINKALEGAREDVEQFLRSWTIKQLIRDSRSGKVAATQTLAKLWGLEAKGQPGRPKSKSSEEEPEQDLTQHLDAQALRLMNGGKDAS